MADILTAIAAIFGVIVSVIAIIFTLKSTKNQEVHNRNSVRPICSIYQTNYENFISVRIKNDGVGPLRFENVRYVCDDGTEVESLFDLLPENIKQLPFHRVVGGKLDGRTLAANGNLYLISIEPKTEEVTRQLREILKKVTIHINYSNIYKEEFPYVKKLDLFSFEFGSSKIRISDVEKSLLWQ